MCKISAKITKLRLAEASQSFQFFRQITWFLGNYRVLYKFRYRILHNLLSIIKLLKNQFLKAKFKLTTTWAILILNNLQLITESCLYLHIISQKPVLKWHENAGTIIIKHIIDIWLWTGFWLWHKKPKKLFCY